MGVALASAQCEGPIVPIRAGRLDAAVAGPFGVPRPEQTLAEHTESLSVLSCSTLLILAADADTRP